MPLFVRLAAGADLDEELERTIRDRLRRAMSRTGSSACPRSR
jgi:acyl-coenzyme A synthetase/AMP-(fatty) acid ligase